ncbi:MAG: 4-alpha-glucanotransferase [Elusimicrobia bacterium]|nr:4-alpha-glucanotransferase [Elusimicrobiota bacterium]
MLSRRASGILLHPTSLPGPWGSGDLGPAAHEFLEALAACGQSWWQMLPVVPAGAGASPYSARSVFAGEPLLVSPEALVEAGYLASGDLKPPRLPGGRADFESAWRAKRPLFELAFDAFERGAGSGARRAFESFRAENALWLEDYALFAALREIHDDASWIGWEKPLRRRERRALESARRSLAREIRFHAFVQHQFALQWESLRARTRALGVGLIGDIPIFVAHDSAEVWAHQELFQLDPEGRSIAVAGVPPDYFSRTGQLWGNPLYRWDVMRRRGYKWWIARFKSAFTRFDAVRLDHFIGFHNYWEIPADAPTAEAGRWVPGPGEDLFLRVKEALGPLALIAEDLGVVTRGVKDLRGRLGFPGIRVMQMAFGTDPEAESYRPHNYPEDCVAYTGTHDNDTTLGWFRDDGGKSSTRTRAEIERERAAALRYTGRDGREVNWDFIRLIFASRANTAIVPMQDILGLGSQARMNLPGTAEGNWRWRMKEGALTPKLSRRLAEMTAEAGRRPKKSRGEILRTAPQARSRARSAAAPASAPRRTR